MRPPFWYTLAWYLVLPWVALYLCWRGLRQRDYLRHWGERFFGHAASGDAAAGEPCIWIHAVSVGETRAAQPLIEQLVERFPGVRFVLTHMTPTGRAAGAALPPALRERIHQRYLPYDLPHAVERFLREVRPRVGVLMETEIWPTLLYRARRHRIPLLLASARLSPRSLQRMLRAPGLMAGAAGGLARIAAQSEADAERLRRVYQGPMVVTGNLKFDLVPDPALLAEGWRLRARVLETLGLVEDAWRTVPGEAERPIWLFASTREGEEALILDAWTGFERTLPGAGARPVLLIVPRHPQRFESVAALLRARGLRPWRRGQWPHAPVGDGAETPLVLLGDSMGEMPLYYAMADVALIGGSLLPLGGQNLIEACACACPVVMGPHMFNFAQAAELARAAGAARQVGSARAALDELARISVDGEARRGMAEAARAFGAAHGGATARTVEVIADMVRAASGHQ